MTTVKPVDVLNYKGHQAHFFYSQVSISKNQFLGTTYYWDSSLDYRFPNFQKQNSAHDAYSRISGKKSIISSRGIYMDVSRIPYPRYYPIGLVSTEKDYTWVGQIVVTEEDYEKWSKTKITNLEESLKIIDLAIVNQLNWLNAFISMEILDIVIYNPKGEKILTMEGIWPWAEANELAKSNIDYFS